MCIYRGIAFTSGLAVLHTNVYIRLKGVIPNARNCTLIHARQPGYYRTYAGKVPLRGNNMHKYVRNIVDRIVVQVRVLVDKCEAWGSILRGD